MHADAEIRHFPSESFDIAISRFGTMFFADPISAFANIARALRPGGRLLLMVWQQHDRNEWSVLIERALAAATDSGPASPTLLDPFSLADPTTTERILVTAGFKGVSFTDVHEPVYYGPDVASALGWIRGFSSVNDVLQRQNSTSTELILERLRQRLATRASAEGIWLDSRAWIVGANRG
jgi:SAM-dependent methyltransferase